MIIPGAFCCDPPAVDCSACPSMGPEIDIGNPGWTRRTGECPDGECSAYGGSYFPPWLGQTGFQDYTGCEWNHTEQHGTYPCTPRFTAFAVFANNIVTVGGVQKHRISWTVVLALGNPSASSQYSQATYYLEVILEDEPAADDCCDLRTGDSPLVLPMVSSSHSGTLAYGCTGNFPATVDLYPHCP